MDGLYAPSVSHRFVTLFTFMGIPSPLDIRFQKISGLNRTLNTTTLNQGGENKRNIHLAEKIQHGSLVLERGVMGVTPLTVQFERVLRGDKALYANVVILLLNHHNVPVSSWTVSNALPVSWSMGDLDANSNTAMVNRIELKYQNMRWLGARA
ncbi:phage tail protein (plasmid) [Vibrio cyclitrophicus]|uniref:phage tail protein n=1 Tax=Vibrio cyclitrophicus TaxID=47951 RepID=UPI000C82EB7F|nr:phage tail protein [Vibrio cyclitrophicus]